MIAHFELEILHRSSYIGGYFAKKPCAGFGLVFYPSKHDRKDAKNMGGSRRTPYTLINFFPGKGATLSMLSCVVDGRVKTYQLDSSGKSVEFHCLKSSVAITKCCWSESGKSLAFGDESGDVCIVSARTGKQQLKLAQCVSFCVLFVFWRVNYMCCI